MIEVRNSKVYQQCNGGFELKGKSNIIQNINAILYDIYSADNDDFLCKIVGDQQNVWVIFDSAEKAERFYNDFKKLLPDSPDKMQSIDCKDYE